MINKGYRTPKKPAIFTLFGLMTILVSFKGPNSIEATNKTQSNTDQFIEHLKNGKALASFFADKWTLIYHEDNRCSGSTDGQLETLKNTEIDEVIKLNVKNDGEGWACEKTSPKSYDLNFDLKNLVTSWDRFEIPDFENDEKDTVYIVGAGASDYIKLYYNDKNLIVNMKYSSEDPG